MKLLKKKIDECVRVVFAIMSTITDNLLWDNAFSELDERKKVEILLEFLSYHLYSLERLHFARLGGAERKELSEAVFQEIHSYLLSTCKQELCPLFKAFPELHKKRESEYRGYMDIPVDSPWGFKGVLEWEFASRISAMLGRPDDPDKIFVISKLNHIWVDHAKLLEKILLEGKDDRDAEKNAV